MDYTILSIGPRRSIVKTNKGNIVITDVSILSQVGNATYGLLYFDNTSLYTKFHSCSSSSWKNTIRTGMGSTIVDLQTWFMDTNYTSYNLKEDIIRILIGEEPINEDAKKLIGSSLYDPTLNITGWDWIITIFIIIISFVAISWVVLIQNTSLDICKINNYIPANSK